MTEIVGTIKTLGDIDSLLNLDLSDLADLAAFKVPADGRYSLGVEAETKEINKHPAVVINYTVIGVIELANPEDAPPTIGDKFSENFNLDNELGLGKLKRALRPYAEHFATSNIGELLELMQGITVEGTVKRREDAVKLDDDGNKRVYGSVANVVVL